MSADGFGRFDEPPLLDSGEDFSGPNLREEVRLGNACKVLIESEPYKLATARMQDAIWEAFKVTPMRDTEGLTYLRMMQKAVEDMHKLFAEGADTGMLAAEQLTQMVEAGRQAAEPEEV